MPICTPLSLSSQPSCAYAQCDFRWAPLKKKTLNFSTCIIKQNKCDFVSLYSRVQKNKKTIIRRAKLQIYNELCIKNCSVQRSNYIVKYPSVSNIGLGLFCLTRSFLSCGVISPPTYRWRDWFIREARRLLTVCFFEQNTTRAVCASLTKKRFLSRERCCFHVVVFLQQK